VSAAGLAMMEKYFLALEVLPKWENGKDAPT